MAGSLARNPQPLSSGEGHAPPQPAPLLPFTSYRRLGGFTSSSPTGSQASSFFYPERKPVSTTVVFWPVRQAPHHRLPRPLYSLLSAALGKVFPSPQDSGGDCQGQGLSGTLVDPRERVSDF